MELAVLLVPLRAVQIGGLRRPTRPVKRVVLYWKEVECGPKPWYKEQTGRENDEDESILYQGAVSERSTSSSIRHS